MPRPARSRADPNSVFTADKAGWPPERNATAGVPYPDYAPFSRYSAVQWAILPLPGSTAAAAHSCLLRMPPDNCREAVLGSRSNSHVQPCALTSKAETWEQRAKRPRRAACASAARRDAQRPRPLSVLLPRAARSGRHARSCWSNWPTKRGECRHALQAGIPPAPSTAAPAARGRGRGPAGSRAPRGAADFAFHVPCPAGAGRVPTAIRIRSRTWARYLRRLAARPAVRQAGVARSARGER